MCGTTRRRVWNQSRTQASPSMPYRTGKNRNGRFVVTPARDGRPAVTRYYPHESAAEINAAIIEELGLPAETPIKLTLQQWSVTPTGWENDDDGRTLPGISSMKANSKTPRYVADLLACRSDAECCCLFTDGGQVGATVLYRDGWLVVQHFAGNAVKTCEEIALVTLDEEADHERLTAAALATVIPRRDA